MYKAQKVAEQKYGVADTRPQDKDLPFLKYLRRLNQAIGEWAQWPEPSSQVKEAVSKSSLPTDICLTVPEGWLFNTDVKARLVQSPDTYVKMMEDVKRQKIVGLDFEFHTKHSYNGLLALIQLSTPNGNYVIDPFELRDVLLNDFSKEVLSNAELLKVMCGCEQDVLFVQSNFRCFLIGVLDVQKLYLEWKFEQPAHCYEVMKHVVRYHAEEGKKKLPISDNEVKVIWEQSPSVSYRKLVEGLYWEYDVTLNKDATHGDFRQRPLEKLGNLAYYAAADVHYLLRIFELLRNRVTHDALTRAFETTKKCLKSTFRNKKYPAVSKLLGKEIKIPTELQQERFVGLHKWRDMMGCYMDENPVSIMTNKELELLALNYTGIQKVEDLSKFISSNQSPIVAKQKVTILAILKNPGEALQKILSIECHNCFGVAHQGWACPWPSDPSRWKEYMNRPENQMFKDRQQLRRAMNWYNKTGVWPKDAPRPDSIP